MSNQETHETLQAPEAIKISAMVKVISAIMVLIGVAAFVYSLRSEHQNYAWGGYLIGIFFMLSLAVFGPLWVSILYMSRGIWSVTMRRIPEAMGAALIPAGVLTLAVVVGLHSLYHWSHADVVAKDELLLHKAPFLNPTLFMILISLSLIIWIVFNHILRRNSLKQDEDGKASYSINNITFSAIFILLFSLTYSVVSFYLLMSLDAHWFSTMFAVLTFTDMVQTGLAFVSIVAAVLVMQGKLKGYLNENHLHGVGKMLFAATGFWAYIYFSQFLLIWYGNLPEETAYFIKRWENGWLVYLAILPFVKFLVPFVILVPRENKRKPLRLLSMAVLIIFAQFLELYVMVAPALGHGSEVAHGHLPVIEFLMFLGFTGLFVLLFAVAVGRKKSVPLNDPYIRESIHHHT